MTVRPYTDDARPLVARPVAVLALGAVALIHLLDLPGKIEEVPYLGVAYILLIVSAMGVAALLLVRDRRSDWLLVAGLAGATVAGFVVDRTTGLPMATTDIGNWLEPLGLASLFVEVTLVLLALWAHREYAGQGRSQMPDQQPQHV